MAPKPGVAADHPGRVSDGEELELSAVERRILQALSNRPLGLCRASSVAVAAEVGRDEVQPALDRLVELGLVSGTEEPIRSLPVRREVVWRLEVVEAWWRVPEMLKWAPRPKMKSAPMPDCVPDRFRHLFWWGDPKLCKLPRDAVFVAEQILTSDDVTSWNWALSRLPCEALDRVAERPHVPEDRKQVIRSTLARRRDEPVGTL